MINNAGVCIPGELQWLTWEQCQRSLQVNLEGAVRVTKAFLPLLQQAKGESGHGRDCICTAGKISFQKDGGSTDSTVAYHTQLVRVLAN